MGMRKFQIFALYSPHFAGGAEVRAGAGHHPGGQNAMSAACTWRSICERRVIFPSLTDGKMSSACLSISFLQNEMRVSDVARPKQIRALVHAREEVFCPKDESLEGPPSARQPPPKGYVTRRPALRTTTFLFFQHLIHIVPRVRIMPLRDLLRCPAGDHGSASVPALRTHVDNVIGSLDDVQVVLDDHSRIAALHQLAEDLRQLGDIVKMQAGRGLIEDIDGLSGALSGQLCRQLNPLRLAARELRGRLSELDIAQPDIVEGLDLTPDAGYIFKKYHRLLDGHFQNVGDIFPFIADLQCLAVVALSVAHFAGHIYIGEEMHLDLDDAVARAGLTASALHVERKTSLGIAAGAGVLGPREKGSDQVKDAGVSRGIGAGCPPDRGLVYIDDLVQLVDPLDIVVLSGNGARPVQVAGQPLDRIRR